MWVHGQQHPWYGDGGDDEWEEGKGNVLGQIRGKAEQENGDTS